MRAKYLQKLKSPLRGERMAAWSDLHLEPETSQGFVTVEDRRELYEVLRAEEDDGVRMQAIMALLGLNSACQAFALDGAPHGRKKQLRKNARSVQTLHEWFSQLFERPSALLGIAEADYRRRDEDAFSHLARRFPPWEFCDTDLQRVPLSDDSWFQLLLDHGYETILILGRLWMFGQRALDNLQAADLHLWFPESTRPASLEQGAIDPKYHCIREHNGNCKSRIYSTEDAGDKRTDYGLIQVYRSSNGGRWMTVVLCAGCSSLGTLGAARWLAHDIWRPYGADGSSPIPIPRGTGTDSRMEALIKVHAPSPQETWRPSHLELSRLYVNDYVWQPDTAQWHSMKEHVIEVEVKQTRPVSLSIDGQPAGMRSSSQTFRLATQLALAVHDGESDSVSVELLAKNTYIWEGREFPTAKVKQRLHNLDKRSLKGLINIAGDEVRLDAKVNIRQL